MLHITKRNVAKFAARAASASLTHIALSATADAIIDPESDSSTEKNLDTGVTIVSGVTCGLVVWPKTDAAVDRVADWRTARKERKQAAKPE